MSAPGPHPTVPAGAGEPRCGACYTPLLFCWQRYGYGDEYAWEPYCPAHGWRGRGSVTLRRPPVDAAA